MRLKPWQDDDLHSSDDSRTAELRGRDSAARERAAGRDDAVIDRRTAELRDEVVETETERSTRWDVPAALVAVAGIALVVVGAIALVRTGIDRTWYDPVVQVAGLSHTALLGAIEVGVGAVLVLAALAGARMFAGLVALAGAAAAAVIVVEPDTAERELAIEQGWAAALAAAGLAIGLLLILARERREQRHERRVERRPLHGG